jgi:transposase
MAIRVEPVLLALDIGARKHQACWERKGRRHLAEVKNTPEDLRELFASLLAQKDQLRLIVEATGVYYLDAALIASELGAEVMVINPKAAHNFAKALSMRNKTDRLDAAMLLEFLKRMPFQAWSAPSPSRQALRHYGRYLLQLTEDSTAAKNRLHALQHGRGPRSLIQDLKRTIAGQQRRIKRIRQEAVALIQAEPELQHAFQALNSICGIASVSAVSLLSELAVLPPDLSSRACVCHAGLDVRLHQSGDTTKPPRISRHGNKYLRRALYMPAISAVQHDPHARAFQKQLLERGKKKMQTVVAVMRKMLTAAWALTRNPDEYDGSKLYNVALEG